MHYLSQAVLFLLWFKGSAMQIQLHNMILSRILFGPLLFQASFLTCINFLCFAEATTPLRNETDRLALLAFKDQITPDPNGILSSRNDSLHFCRWGGVTSSRRHPQRVTALDLPEKNLVGYLSPYIGNLSFLSFIKLSHNHLQGQISQEIGHVPRLRYLNLGNNSFNGEIPRNLT